MNEDTTPIISEENGRDTKGRFAVGNVGKPKGATNKTTKDLQQFITNFLNEKTFEIPFIWESLDDKEKIMIFLHLAKLVTPKPTIQSQKNENFKFDFDTIQVNIINPTKEITNED